MAQYEYHNAMRLNMDYQRNAHVKLIERVCMELGAPERATEICNKFIDMTIRLKKWKDKSHPKKPKSGYMIYCDQRRADVKKNNPKATFTDMIKMMATEWNSLENKDVYVKLAEEDKLRYATMVEEYNSEIYKSNIN
jgi:hypothetical protein